MIFTRSFINNCCVCHKFKTQIWVVRHKQFFLRFYWDLRWGGRLRSYSPFWLFTRLPLHLTLFGIMEEREKESELKSFFSSCLFLGIFERRKKQNKRTLHRRPALCCSHRRPPPPFALSTSSSFYVIVVLCVDLVIDLVLLFSLSTSTLSTFCIVNLVILAVLCHQPPLCRRPHPLGRHLRRRQNCPSLADEKRLVGFLSWSASSVSLELIF